MQDFPANSQKAKGAGAAEPREKVAQVTSAETVRRKRGLGKKFKETFVNGDARSVGDYIVFDVVIPSMKDMFVEAFEGGMRRLVYGETHKRHNTSSGYSGLGNIAYNAINKPTAAAPGPRSLSRRARARFDFDDVIIQTRQEANEVLDRLYEELSRYGSVSVGVLYELTGIESSHTDMKWGWTDLRGSKALPLRGGGYLLDLPDPEALG